MSGNEHDLRKVTGPRHLLAALGFSLGGFMRLVRETAFRHELAAMAVSLALFATVHASLGEFVALVIVFLMLCAVEALNTAIEEIIDRISPELSSTGRHAKDLGSFAVLCLLGAWGCLVLYVLFSHLILHS
ncbi:diacylglycerol kinase [Rhizobium oryzicola]|uniref:Diacylglycerol kinase n=1 Tax=Rhizobium oryzicola TaxID=1232668 RepID=A0ABT8T0A6_9HYPH|nr:diacylglycerol kinase [Rhizobium oryzicola]MDO1583671.1 diacylglycerol kinase [Rhizobium oryzicola]